MGVVYQQPSSNYNRNQTPSEISVREILVGILCIVAIGVAIGAVIFLGLTIYTAIVYLTWPAVVRAFTEPAPLSVSTCAILVLEAFLAGLVIGLIRKALDFRSKAMKTFLSDVISFRVFSRDETVLPTLLLSLLVSGVVGWIASSAGSVGLTDLALGEAHIGSLSVTAAVTPVMGIAGGGGAGGIGSGGGVLGSGFFWVLMILIAFAVQGAIVGALSGFTFGILFGAIRGAVRGGTVSAVVSLVSIDIRKASKAEVVLGSTRAGIVQGAIVGSIVGLIQGTIAAKAFYSNRQE